MEQAGWTYRRVSVPPHPPSAGSRPRTPRPRGGLLSRRAAVNEKQGRHSSHFALVRFAMMTTYLDLAAELLSALIAGHEERTGVREERKGAGGHVKALGGSALATPSRWPRWSRALTQRVQ